MVNYAEAMKHVLWAQKRLKDICNNPVMEDSEKVEIVRGVGVELEENLKLKEVEVLAEREEEFRLAVEENEKTMITNAYDQMRHMIATGGKIVVIKITKTSLDISFKNDKNVG